MLENAAAPPAVRSHEYLVKWRGRSYEESSWEAAGDISGDRETAVAIAKFAKRRDCDGRRPLDAVPSAPPGTLFAIALEKAQIPRIDIQPVTYTTPLIPIAGHALRVSTVHGGPSLSVGVGDVICGIGDLEVLGRRLDEICAQIQTALNVFSNVRKSLHLTSIQYK
jgi:hypothetical protein